MNERRRHYDHSPRIQHAASTTIDNTKWCRPNSFAHDYFVAMGWELLVAEPDGLLFRAPEGFTAHAIERLPS